MNDVAACDAPVTSRRLSTAAKALMVCIALSFFVQGDFRTEDDLAGKPKEYHAMMAEAFLAGRTSLLLEPEPALLALNDPFDPVANAPYRLHDASLYHGKYYLYYGPAPALLFFLPFRAVTGHNLRAAFAVPLLCATGYLCACALFSLIVSHNRWILPLWLELCAVALLGTTSFVFYLMTRAMFYEVSIAAGYLLIHAAFLCLFLALRSPSPGWAWLAASGLLFGCAFGSRPNLALAAWLAGVALAWHYWGQWRVILTFSAGILLCGGGFAWYNYIRFGNIFEFGTKYGLSAFGHVDMDVTLRHVLPTLRLYFLTPFTVGPQFPFLSVSQLVTDPRFPQSTEPFVGILTSAPILLLGILAPFFWKPRDATGAVFHGMYGAAILLLSFMAFVGWVTGRYLVDFAPLLTFCSLLVLRDLWEKARAARVVRAVAITLCAYSVILIVVLSSPSPARLLRYFGRA